MMVGRKSLSHELSPTSPVVVAREVMVDVTTPAVAVVVLSVTVSNALPIEVLIL